MQLATIQAFAISLYTRWVYPWWVDVSVQPFTAVRRASNKKRHQAELNHVDGQAIPSPAPVRRPKFADLNLAARIRLTPQLQANPALVTPLLRTRRRPRKDHVRDMCIGHLAFLRHVADSACRRSSVSCHAPFLNSRLWCLRRLLGGRLQMRGLRWCQLKTVGPSASQNVTGARCLRGIELIEFSTSTV